MVIRPDLKPYPSKIKKNGTVLYGFSGLIRRIEFENAYILDQSISAILPGFSGEFGHPRA